MALIIGGKNTASEVRAKAAARVALLLACGLALTLVMPLVASAASVTTPTPVANGTLDLQAWPDSGQLIIVTAITVPESVRLPATVRVPVVEGATVQWAGEVLGGDLSADPERKYTMIKSPAGGQYAEFTLETTRSAQVDSSLPGLTVDGSKTTASFEWIQSVSSPFTSFSLRVPANSGNVVVSPKPSAAPEQNTAGETLYSGDPLTLAPGARQKVTLSYTAGAAGAAGGTSSSLNTLIYVLGFALAVALVVLVVLIVRQRQGTGIAAPTASARRPSEKAAATKPSKAEEDGPDDDTWGFDVEE
jgi:hypothetical protein